MCFKSKTPKPKEPPPPSTERDAELTGVQERQRAAGGEAASGTSSTILTSPAGATGAAPTARPTLGGY